MDEIQYLCWMDQWVVFSWLTLNFYAVDYRVQERNVAVIFRKNLK